MQIGDLVKKQTGSCSGMIGLLLTLETNSKGHSFGEILTLDGKIRTWYLNLVEVIHEIKISKK